MIVTTLLMALLQPLGLDDTTVSESRSWDQRYPMTSPAPRLTVRNVWGPVFVTVHDEPSIRVEALERRSARDAATLEQSRDLLFLTTTAGEQSLEMSVDGITRNWHDHDPCPDCELRLELRIMVPRQSIVDVATVMDGAVEVLDVTGAVSARNVNGDVRALDIAACERIGSVNGEVRVTFAAAPEHEDCRIETINGDMQLALPAPGHADLAFRLGHGTIRSELAIEPQPVAARVERTTEGSLSRYRVVQPAAVRVGRGGARFDFESMNGDVLITRATRSDPATSP